MVPQLVMSQDPKDIKLVKDLVIRLAEEQEVLWIEEIIGVLVNRGEWMCVLELVGWILWKNWCCGLRRSSESC